MNDIKVWAQMFFDDGSVSEGVRISADVFDSEPAIDEVAQKLLNSTNREIGIMLIWGAGEIDIYECCINVCPLKGSKTSVSQLWSASPPEQNSI
jgi:hypothetical protein